MPRNVKKKEAAGTVEKSVEQLILEKTQGKYSVVYLATIWALVLRRQEEYRHLSQPEILDIALRDVLTGDVEEAEIVSHAKEVAIAPLTDPSANGREGSEKEKK